MIHFDGQKDEMVYLENNHAEISNIEKPKRGNKIPNRNHENEEQRVRTPST